MPEKTLLDYTQDILSALDSDEVNSITDTVESMQVVRILKRTYDSIVTRADLVEHYTFFELNASGDNDKPVLMTRPSGVNSIIWIKYNKATEDNDNENMTEMTYMPFKEFVEWTNNLNEDEDFVDTMSHTIGTDTLTIKYRNDIGPTYYTTFNDHTLLFDAYDEEVDTTLQKSKTLCWGKKDQEWETDDDFIPFIDVEFGTLLLNEALVTAFAELKQVPNEIATKWANRAWTALHNRKTAINQRDNPLRNTPDYGRR